MAKHKRRQYKRKSPVKIWEWWVTIVFGFISATIVWTNNSLQLLNYFGINMLPGQAAIIFIGITVMLASWFIINILRHNRII